MYVYIWIDPSANNIDSNNDDNNSNTNTNNIVSNNDNDKSNNTYTSIDDNDNNKSADIIPGCRRGVHYFCDAVQNTHLLVLNLFTFSHFVGALYLLALFGAQLADFCLV